MAGPRFDLELVAALGCEPGLAELLTSGLVAETEPGVRAFRHALARDAIYEDVPGRGAAPFTGAWPRRSRPAAVRASRSRRTGSPRARARGRSMRCCAPRRARGAARLSRRGPRPPGARWSCGPTASARRERSALLERYARSAELAGELTEATRAWREAVAARRAEGVGRALADAQRHLAAIYELRATASARSPRGAWRPMRSRPTACPARRPPSGWSSPATCRAPAATARRSTLARAPGEEAARAERIDLRARALGLEGVATAKRGELRRRRRDGPRRAVARARARAHAEAAELYQRLGTALETAGDYGGAREALDHRASGSADGGADALEHVCLTCVAYVLRELGDWDAAVELCRELARATAPRRHARGRRRARRDPRLPRRAPRAARPLLAALPRHGHAPGRRLDGRRQRRRAAWLGRRRATARRAAEHCRCVLERWERSEDLHYAVWGLRWAASFFAAQRRRSPARAPAPRRCRRSRAPPGIPTRSPRSPTCSARRRCEGDAGGPRSRSAARWSSGTLDMPFERAQI